MFLWAQGFIWIIITYHCDLLIVIIKQDSHVTTRCEPILLVEITCNPHKNSMITHPCPNFKDVFSFSKFFTQYKHPIDRVTQAESVKLLWLLKELQLVGQFHDFMIKRSKKVCWGYVARRGLRSSITVNVKLPARYPRRVMQPRIHVWITTDSFLKALSHLSR